MRGDNNVSEVPRMGYIGGGLIERPCAAIFVLTRHLDCWTLNVSVTTYLLFMTNNKRKMYNKKK